MLSSATDQGTQQRVATALDDGASVGERLSKASCPEEVAEIVAALPRDHQLLRLNKWAALSDKELDAITVLTPAAKHRISQVCTPSTMNTP